MSKMSSRGDHRRMLKVPYLSRSGSIIVDYDVILKIQYTPEYKDVLQDIRSNVQEKTINATMVQVSGVNNNCTGKALLEGRALREWLLIPLTFDPGAGEV